MKKINKLLAAVAVFASAFTLICSSIVTEAKPIDPYTYTVRIISGGDANFIGTDGITIDDSSAKVDIASDKKMLTISNLILSFSINSRLYKRDIGLIQSFLRINSSLLAPFLLQ